MRSREFSLYRCLTAELFTKYLDLSEDGVCLQVPTVMRAMYDFEPRQNDEIAFQQGDKLEVIGDG